MHGKLNQMHLDLNLTNSIILPESLDNTNKGFEDLGRNTLGFGIPSITVKDELLVSTKIKEDFVGTPYNNQIANILKDLGKSNNSNTRELKTSLAGNYDTYTELSTSNKISEKSGPYGDVTPTHSMEMSNFLGNLTIEFIKPYEISQIESFSDDKTQTKNKKMVCVKDFNEEKINNKNDSSKIIRKKLLKGQSNENCTERS